MKYVTDRELTVLRMRLKKHTYQEIGDALGVTRYRAKNIHDQAVLKLVLREVETDDLAHLAHTSPDLAPGEDNRDLAPEPL